MVSEELEQWLRSDQPRTLGNIIELFGPRSFALVFVLLMSVPALPLPTGGATHVLEVVTMLVALQLIVGSVFGLLVFGLALTAFLAPPFSGLDTLPSLGVVVMGLGVLMRDALLAVVGAVIGAVGVATVLALGTLVVRAAEHVI
jgi:hypothetical protein